MGLLTALHADPAGDPKLGTTASAAAPAETTITGTVRKITVNHGNLITTITAADLAKIGIVPGQSFVLQIGESEHTVRYGTAYEDASPGEWVAIAKAGGLIWIARNGESAAKSVNAEVGMNVRVHPAKPAQ